MIYVIRPQIPNIKLAYFSSYVDPREKEFETSLKYAVRPDLPDIKFFQYKSTQEETDLIYIEDEHKRQTKKVIPINDNKQAFKPALPTVKAAWNINILDTINETKIINTASRHEIILTEYYKSTDNLVMAPGFTKIEKVGD